MRDRHYRHLRLLITTPITTTFSLRVKLPFEDEEFDYIHVSGIAFAVPENKVRDHTVVMNIYILIEAYFWLQWLSLFEVCTAFCCNTLVNQP